MTKQFFVGKVNYPSEAMRLLAHLGKGKSYEELKKELSRKYNVGTEAFEEKFRLLMELEKEAIRCLSGKEELVKEYFSCSGEDGKGGNLATAAILWDGAELEMQDTLEAWKEELAMLSEEEYCKQYGIFLQSYTSGMMDEWDGRFCKSRMDVIELLLEMELSGEEKWKLQSIFLKPQPHREIVFELLQIVITVLQSYGDALEKLAREFAAYWEKRLAGKRMAEFLNEEVGFVLEENPLGFGMCPGICSPNVISLYAESQEDGQLSSPYLFTIGILFDDDFRLNAMGENRKEKQEYYLKVLKILSDGSKFEILSYIKDKSAYGSQLAKHLSLTTATISHHMSALLSAGLVTMETKESKVYYRGNTKAIEEVLEYCRQVLLQ